MTQVQVNYDDKENATSQEGARILDGITTTTKATIKKMGTETNKTRASPLLYITRKVARKLQTF